MRTDRHDEGNSRFSQFCEKHRNNSCLFRVSNPGPSSPHCNHHIAWGIPAPRGLIKLLSSKPTEIPFRMAAVAAVVHTENTPRDKQVTAKLTCSVAWLNKQQGNNGHQQTLFCLDQTAYITISGVFTCVPNQTDPQCFPHTKRDFTMAL
jgi:hypothetical protein